MGRSVLTSASVLVYCSNMWLMLAFQPTGQTPAYLGFYCFKKRGLWTPERFGRHFFVQSICHLIVLNSIMPWYCRHCNMLTSVIRSSRQFQTNFELIRWHVRVFIVVWLLERVKMFRPLWTLLRFSHRQISAAYISAWKTSMNSQWFINITSGLHHVFQFQLQCLFCISQYIISTSLSDGELWYYLRHHFIWVLEGLVA